MSTRVLLRLQRTVVSRSTSTAASSRGRSARSVAATQTPQPISEDSAEYKRLEATLQQHAQGPSLSWTSPESDFVGAAFESFDTNMDGTLDLQEVIDGARKMGLTEVEATALFYKMDANGDGVISKAEFSIAIVNQAVNKSISFSSPESDFVAQHFDQLDKNSDGVLSREEVVRGAHLMGLSPAEANALFDKMDVNGDNVVSKAEFSIAAADHGVNKSLSFASPESDFVATRPEEARQEPRTFGWLLFPTSLSFASPESDFCAPTADELAAPTHMTTLSFASPESDFCAPTADEIDRAPLAAYTSLSFGSPEADFCAPTVEQINAEPHHTTLSFASPESDFCAPTAEEQNRTLEPTTLSFSSPDTDFCAPNRYELESPLTLTAALAPSSEAKVITKAHAPFEITHVNAAWTHLCGYSQEASAGKTLKLLQGPETELDTVNQMMARLLDGKATEGVITNYDKRGRVFRNHLKAEPVFNDEGEITHFLGVLKEVGTQRASALLK